MRIRRFGSQAALLVLVLLAFTALASAGVYNSLVVYGDSLSDNGNIFAADHGVFPPPPYWMGRQSNGPVAVEDLAHNLGLPLLDFAWIGATTGVGNIADGGTQTMLGTFHFPGMTTQLALTHNLVPPGSLAVVWGGADDFLSNGFSQDTANLAVSNILNIVAQLQAIGVSHVIVPGLPDLGLTPEFFGNAGATALSIYFNHILLAGLPNGANYVDTFGLLHQIVANPGAFGLTNVTDPCFDGVSVCANPDQYLFWDNFHPTERGHEITAGFIESTVVPEPSTLLMLGSSVVGLAAIVRRRLAA